MNLKAIKRLICVICTLCLAFSFLGCTPDEKESGISIVATIFPAYDFARELAGEIASVKMLMSPGNEVHSYEPSPKDMLEIQKCDLFIYTGGESDTWVEELLKAKEYENIKTLRMTDCVKLEKEELKEGMEEESDEDENEDEYDEHVWTSPVNAIKISEEIVKALCDIDSENADTYKAKLEVYKTKLNSLDSQLREIASSINNKTLIFADRFPMRYFADEYGFDYYAAFPGCSSKTEASSATVVFLIEKVKSENIPAVFCIEFSDGRLADTICSETGANKYTLHSCHNVTRDDFENGVTYIELMDRNIKTLKEAFSL